MVSGEWWLLRFVCAKFVCSRDSFPLTILLSGGEELGEQAPLAVLGRQFFRMPLDGDNVMTVGALRCPRSGRPAPRPTGPGSGPGT